MSSLVLIDHREFDVFEGNEVADFCVVGAGVAGITLVRRLIGHGKRVVLLESGGSDYEADVAELNAGRNEGLPYYDLEDSRLRFFGGTAAIWGGRCAELDEIDFEPRAWVRYSGWPFRKQTLLPYYAEARRLLELDQQPLDEGLWNRLGVDPPCFGSEVVAADFWQFDDAWDRFGFRANRQLLEHPDLRAYVHASVVEVHVNESGTAVEGVEIASPSGQRSFIRAKTFILAAGGIENARILLASNSRQANGIGNSHDVVGRYFMEHPHARGGQLHVEDLWKSLKTFRSTHWHAGSRYAACLRPTDRLQRAERILNSSFAPRVRPHPDATRALTGRLYQSIKERAVPTSGSRTIWQATRSINRWSKRLSHPLKPWLDVQLGRQGLYLSVRAEQAPNPDSRVRLTNERDVHGMPRVALDWRLSDIDKRTVAALVRKLDEQMRREKSGGILPAPWLADPDCVWEHDPLISFHAIGGYHHMGTTRMASDPRCGVVDAHSRVHGIGTPGFGNAFQTPFARNGPSLI